MALPSVYFLILRCAPSPGMVVNMALLDFMDEDSPYRASHSLVGIILLFGFFYSFGNRKSSRLKLLLLLSLSLIPCYLGTVFPDLDICLLGIGGHRNPIFHSSVPFLVVIILFQKSRSVGIRAMIAGFGIGIASHLFWDAFDHADVRWIPGGTYDRLWLIANGFLSLGLAKMLLGSQMSIDGKSRVD